MTELKNCKETLLESSGKMFRAWMEEVKTICGDAVFEQQRDVIEQVYEHLEQKEKTLKATIDRLLVHLGKLSSNACSSTSTFLPAAQKDMDDTAVERILASLPLVSSPSPPADNTISAPPPLPGFSRPNGKFIPPPYHNPNNKNTLPNNSRDECEEGRSNPATTEPLVQLQQLADSGDDRSSVDSDGAREFIPKKIFLVNLARDSEARTIAQHFNQYGQVIDVKTFRFPNGEPRGTGSVEFANIAGAQKSIATSKHMIDRREVVALPFKVSKEKSSDKPTKTFPIFLGGVPTFLSKFEVETAIRKYFKVREVKLISTRGYGYLELENEGDVERILEDRYIKIGEKMVECKPNKRYVYGN